MTEGFEEYIRERRARRDRSQRILLRVLAVACVALAASNVALAMRVIATRGRVAEAPPRQTTSAAQASSKASSGRFQ